MAIQKKKKKKHYSPGAGLGTGGGPGAGTDLGTGVGPVPGAGGGPDGASSMGPKDGGGRPLGPPITPNLGNPAGGAGNLPTIPGGGGPGRPLGPCMGPPGGALSIPAGLRPSPRGGAPIPRGPPMSDRMPGLPASIGGGGKMPLGALNGGMPLAPKPETTKEAIRVSNTNSRRGRTSGARGAATNLLGPFLGTIPSGGGGVWPKGGGRCTGIPPGPKVPNPSFLNSPGK